MNDFLRELAPGLTAVGGVEAVVLGGSRARGTHRPDSDYDVGLYYRGALDVDALRELTAAVADEPAEVTGPGGWGPWVDGGGWLTIGGRRVDWIYRDLDRVEAVWADCRQGRYQVAFQPGHPLGFYSHTYAGETALCQVLADETGVVTALRQEPYPRPLRDALVAGLWEADFMLANAVKGADAAYAAGCLFRVAGVLCQALHADAGRWLLNEKGMVAATGGLPNAPIGFATTVQRCLGSIGTTDTEINQAVSMLTKINATVRASVH
ncbi:nucleotidyltransferase domain-containing protein [Dactylosporangium sp. AC04546]|uniref:nucleotidyltransferase domain-containing protein n=1 Tax=Dactylosporangium sp. AC04546 TaxID=2862460 RepID=UPI001EDDA335|nr:nucleotidyltransferase domain-containing protein [Dactylosporangium sp. AC04546]WVK87628.1 nucleotidyltransferase domain-containing protein [Dactylosporangium sp. AC04546]